MKTKKLACILLVVFCISFALPCFATSNEAISTRSYREELLVSYTEYWYTDGAGVTSHVEFGHQYRTFQFVNGFTSKTSIQQLPITGEYPPGTTKVQKVTISYSFC